VANRRTAKDARKVISGGRCACGAAFKRITGPSSAVPRRDDFYQLGEEPPSGPLCEGASQPDSEEDCPHDSCAGILFPACVLGPLAGQVIWRKGQVRDSGTCPTCGTRFADTLALQAAPQQPVF
jgi:hypothetical protein